MNDNRDGVMVVMVMTAVMVIRLRKRTCREQHDHREQQYLFHQHIRIPSAIILSPMDNDGLSNTAQSHESGQRFYQLRPIVPNVDHGPRDLPRCHRFA
jgi:hypothetical protein